MWLDERLLGESASYTPPEDRQARCGLRRVWVSSPQGEITLMMHTATYLILCVLRFFRDIVRHPFARGFCRPKNGVF